MVDTNISAKISGVPSSCGPLFCPSSTTLNCGRLFTNLCQLQELLVSNEMSFMYSETIRNEK